MTAQDIPHCNNKSSGKRKWECGRGGWRNQQTNYENFSELRDV